MRLPTVTVDRGGVPVVINKSDFRPYRDRIWGTEPEPEPVPVPPESAKDTKDDLIERLAAHGVKKDRRTSLENLRELLAEHEAS